MSLPKIPAWVDEVIVVDDHSTDRTVAVARELRPGVRIVANRRERREGQRAAGGMGGRDR